MSKERETEGSQVGGDRNEAAAYIADLTADLAAIARTHGLETLSYVLEIARLEAENAAHR